MTEAPRSSTPRQFSLLSVTGIALTTFMVGLYVGSVFLGSIGSPPPAPVANLPPGHPTVDPNAPTPAPPLTPDQMANAPQTDSGTAAPAQTAPKEGWDLKHDDPAVRAAIEKTNDYRQLVHIGNEQFDLKHPHLAIAAYEKALKIHPFDPDVQTDLGIMYRATHRHEDALNSFRKAAQMDPKHVQSRYNIGVVLASDENDAKGAIEAWEDYLRVAPPGPQAEDVKQRIAALKKTSDKS